MTQINQYPIEASELGDNDLLDIDKEISPSVYETQKIKGNKIKFRRKQTTGVSVVFSEEFIYNTASSPATGNVSFDQTNSRLGVIQKMYHNDTVAPTFSGVTDIQKITTNPYVPNVLNIFLFEWTEDNRVEYHIMQEG